MKKLIFAILAFTALGLILIIGIPGLTPSQNAVFSIFVFAAIMWISEAIPLYVTSLLILFLGGLLLPPLTKDVTFNSITASFFNPTLLLFMGGFAIARTITVYRLDDKIARKIVQRAGGSPLRFLIAISCVTAFLSMWMSNTATAALMLAVPLPILRKMSYDDKFRTGIILAVPFAANIGGIGTPIGTPPNAIALSQLKQIGIEISFAKWLLISFPVLIITLIFMIFILYKLFPPKSRTLPDIEVTATKTTPKQLLAIGMIIFTVLLWLTTSLHGLSSSLIALIPAIFVFGTGMLHRDHFQQLGWNVLILIGGGTALGYLLQQTGLDRWIIDKLGLAAIPAVVAIIIATSMTGLLSNFMSNTSSAALVMPIILGLSTIDPALGSVAVALGASAAMILPISTPPNAIAYGSDMIKVKDMIKGGTLIFLFMLFMIILHSIYIWKFLL